MKFSWKMCLLTGLLSILILSVGGYVLISALFQSTYAREVSNAMEENQMLQYSFIASWNTSVENLELTEEHVIEAAEAMEKGMSGSRIRISDEEKEILFDNTGSEKDETLLEAVSEQSRGCVLHQTENGYELQTTSRILMSEERFIYLESVRDVSRIFEERDDQYDIYRIWLLVLLVLECISSFVSALWLLRPLKELSKTAKQLSDGDLTVRAQVKSRDEVGELAVNFNEMADSLEQKVQQLEDAARRQEDFIGSFAHELKTPLTSMIGYADMLRSREMAEEERFEAANYIFKEGKRLEALSLKLLELLVVKHGALERKWIPVEWLLKDLGGILKPVLEKEKIRLTVQAEETMIYAEPDLMKNVLLNLLDNGRKAIDGEGTLEVIGTSEEQGYALEVRDNGKGMPKEEIERITEAFYMIDKSRARSQGGAGLGLSLCMEIVNRHGGTLEFQSEVGTGTTVRIFLPKEENQWENIY